MAEPVERWSAGKKSLAYTVELEGAEVHVTHSSPWGPRARTYVVDRVEVTTRWELGREEEGKTFVRLAVREVIGGQATMREGTLYPDQLDEVPPWLTSLETRASPRDVG